MTTYDSLVSSATIGYFKERFTSQSSARYDDDTVEEAIRYVLNQIGRINACDEFTTMIDMVSMDQIAIPKELKWLIQPSSVRIGTSRYFEELKDTESLFVSDSDEKFKLATWVESWNIILNVLKKTHGADAHTVTVSSQRVLRTLDDTTLKSLVMMDGTSSVGFSPSTEPIVVTNLPIKACYTAEAFDDSFFQDLVGESVSRINAR